MSQRVFLGDCGMDILWFLRQRLNFASELYDEASAPFREKMRKIEEGEGPFVDMRDPFYQDVSEPAFLQEYLDANKAVEVIRIYCLQLLSVANEAFGRPY